MLRRSDPLAASRNAPEMLRAYYIKMYPAGDPSDDDAGALDPLQLDPVYNGLTASVKIDKLIKVAPPCAKAIVRLIGDEPHFRRQLPICKLADMAERIAAKKCPPQNLPLEASVAKLVTHVKRASVSGLYRDVNIDPQRPHAFANIFTVPKPGKTVADLKCSSWPSVPGEAAFYAHIVQEAQRQGIAGRTPQRLITDARAANTLMDEPTGFEVFTLDSLLQTASNVMQRATRMAKPWYMFNIDIRHMFHQLKLPKELAQLFLLKLHSGRHLGPTAVPMGWNQAPRIAQAVTMSINLGKLSERARPRGIDAKAGTGDALPPWIPLSDGGGVFVILDNDFGVTTSRDIAQSWVDHIKAMCVEFNITLKNPPEVIEMKPTDDSDPSVDHGKRTFMGIEFHYNRWCVKPKHLHAVSLPEGARCSMRFDKVLSLLGEILWFLRVTDQPLREHGDFLALYRSTYPQADDDSESAWKPWKKTVDLDERQVATLGRYLSDARGEGDHKKTAPMRPMWTAKDASMQLWASDASESFVAAVRLGDITVHPATNKSAAHRRAQLIELPNLRCCCREKYSHKHIAVAELRGILMCVIAGLAGGERNVLFIVATDSMTAKGWVERTYCGRDDAQDLLDQLCKLLLRTNSRIICPYIHTLLNIADVPTRNHAEDLHAAMRADDASDRLAATQKLLMETATHAPDDAAKRGSRCAVPEKDSAAAHKLATRRARGE